MPLWKKLIFVNAIKARVEQEDRSAKEIIKEYTRLTEAEKTEILTEIK